jgi:hypothetical protein
MTVTASESHHWWKIQIASVNGWADLKTSTNGAPYEIDYFATAEEAIEYCEGLEFDWNETRVVPGNTPSDNESYG